MPNRIYTWLKEVMKDMHKKENYMTALADLKELDKYNRSKCKEGVGSIG